MKTVKTQIATAMSADFEESTWTFLMPKGFQVWAGQFAIVDKPVYLEMLEMIEFRDKCRDYLMQVEQKDLSVSDSLEALGFGHNGLS